MASQDRLIRFDGCPLCLLLVACLASCAPRLEPGTRLDGAWTNAPYEFSIGLFTGPHPLSLSDPGRPSLRNPVLTGADVTDRPAAFVADPFLVRDGGRWVLFFEVMSAVTRQADIGLATSRDGVRWRYEGIVLDEPFHLSYPFVFRWNDAYYMVPESAAGNAVRLYRAATFPGTWTFVTNLIEGAYVDSTLLHQRDGWYLFASPRGNDTLELFTSPSLTGPWQPHPQSPVIRGNANIARPAGRLITYGTRLLRFGQDCDPSYGSAVGAFEITALTPALYAERPAASAPLLHAGTSRWTRLGMHQVDAMPMEDGTWRAAVDGAGPAGPDRQTDIVFRNGARLDGFSLRPRQATPGQIVLLRWFWSNLPPATEHPLAVFVHFKKGDRMFQADYFLSSDGYHQQLLAIPEGTPPGTWQIRIGLHAPESGERIPLQGTGRHPQDEVRLPIPLRVLKGPASAVPDRGGDKP